MNFMNNNIVNKFNNNEDLYRAVFPRDILSKKDGTISSAAFRVRIGCSVERSYDREESEIIEQMKGWFKGSFIVTVKVDECKKANTYVVYKPSYRSDYHSEIWNTKDKIVLTKPQAKKLAKYAKIVFCPEESEEKE